MSFGFDILLAVIFSTFLLRFHSGTPVEVHLYPAVVNIFILYSLF